MASRYELQATWRERYAMDEFGVARLGKAVTRGAASLPTLIMWALAPREGDQMLLLGGLALLLAVGGLSGLVRLRSWGLLALSGAAARPAGGGGRQRRDLTLSVDRRGPAHAPACGRCRAHPPWAWPG